MERVMPENIDYSRVLPLSVPAIARRRKFFPQNGNTFDFVGSNEIRIQIGSPNSLLDVAHSYLELQLQNTTAATTFGMDLGGAAANFASVRVEQGGRVLSETFEYGRLHASVLSLAQGSKDGIATEGILGIQRCNNTAALLSQAPRAAGAGNAENYSMQTHNADAFLPGTASVRLTMPITSGLFTQDKLLPLPLVNPSEPLTIVLRMQDCDNVGVWSAGGGAADLSIQNCCYNAQLIEVGRDVIDQFRGIQHSLGGQLAISGQDWEHCAGNVPAATAGEFPIRVPVRKRSLKSLFWTASSVDYTGAAAGAGPRNTYNLSFCGNANVDSWNLKVGSVVYPPTPINCWGNVAAGVPWAERGECAMELAKAFGTLGFTNPTGYLSTITYGTDVVGMSNGDNGDGAANTIAPGTASVYAVCPFGIDLEAFQREALESGVDTETLSQEMNLMLNINAITAGPAPSNEDKVINVWVLYDQHYYFGSDGNITYSN